MLFHGFSDTDFVQFFTTNIELSVGLTILDIDIQYIRILHDYLASGHEIAQDWRSIRIVEPLKMFFGWNHTIKFGLIFES